MSREAVAGHARQIVRERAALAGQAVEERRLADVRPADDDDFFQCVICHATYISSAPAAVLKKFSTPFGTGSMRFRFQLPAMLSRYDPANAQSVTSSDHTPARTRRRRANSRSRRERRSGQRDQRIRPASPGERPLDRDRPFGPDRHAPQRQRQKRAAADELADLGGGRVRGRGGERGDAHEQRQQLDLDDRAVRVRARRETAIAQIAATPTFENAWLNPRRPPPSCASPARALRA